MVQQLIAARTSLLSAATSRYRRWLTNLPRGQFWIFFIAACFFNLGFSSFFFLFNLYLLHFGFTERALGVFGSFMALGAILGTIPVGAIAQRFGLRATLIGGISLTVAFSVLRAVIVQEPVQLVLAICAGLALCSWGVCLSPAIAGLTTEDERPIAFSLIFASGIAIAGIGAFAAGRLPRWCGELVRDSHLSSAQETGAALLVSCGVAVLALIPLSRLKLPIASDGVKLPRFSNPFLRRFLPAMALWGVVTGSFAPFANVYFVHHLGVSMEKTGAIFSFSNIGQVVAVLCAPFLFRKAGLVPGIMLTQFATAAALGLLAFAHTGTQAASIYWCYMAVQCMNEPGIYSLLMDRIPSPEHNSASAATFFVSGVAQAVASLAMGSAIVRFGYSDSLVAIALLAIAAAFVFARLRAEQRPSVSA